MSEHDAHSFMPHIGIASGLVIVGYVGTPMKYNCSVFGAPVTLAARCASVKSEPKDGQWISSNIVFPASEWKNRDFDTVFPPQKYKHPDGTIEEQPHSWEMLEPRTVNLKNIGDLEIQETVKKSVHIPSLSPEERAKESLRVLYEAGRYWPKE
jgi:hypothetical protein